MKKIIPYIIWTIVATLWATLCFIAPDFADNPVHSFRTAAVITGYVIALGGATFFILYLAGLSRYIAAVFLPVFGILGAIVSYFRVAFHSTITPMVVDATLHTNGGTIAGVVTWQLITWLLVNILIICILLWWRWHISVNKPWGHAIVILLLWGVYYFGHSRLHMSTNQRYPYNVVVSLVEYAKQRQALQAERLSLPAYAEALPDSIDVIFVLGEAVRADHLSLNGYSRQTCPRLAQQSNILSLPNIYSPYTYTSLSVPYILSPADSLHSGWTNTYYSFIHTFHRHGFYTAWLSNQDKGRNYVAFIHESDTIIFPNASKTSFVFDPWYDEQLLTPLDSLMQHATARNLYVFHMIGSHWYYNNHVTPQHQLFQPVTTERIITKNESQHIINSYDNTILYLDMFLDSIIQRFEGRNAIMLYLSDHGEALGEDGQWLHANDAQPLHYPAALVWYSDRYAASFPDKIHALHQNASRRFRTEYLYPSILSAAGLEVDSLSSDMNIFN